MRRIADVNMRACCIAWDGTAKGREGNAVAAQVGHQDLRFRRVGMQGDIKRIAVIEA